MRMGGREDNGYTWVGAASTANWGARPRDWREYSTLWVWIKRGETQRGAVPQLTFILSDNDGQKAYLHRDGDTCLNWGGGGWRTSIENFDWQLYELPLRQTTPSNCYYATNLDWTQVSLLTIEVRTPLDHADPDDVYLDRMELTRKNNFRFSDGHQTAGWLNGVIPLWKRVVLGQIQAFHLFVRDFETGLVVCLA